MTEFSKTLLAAVAATKTSQRKISQLADIDVSIFSKIVSGHMPPSTNVLQKLRTYLNPEHFPALTEDWSNDLLTAYLRDSAADIGLDTSELDIQIGPRDSTRRFAEFAPPLLELLYNLGKGAQIDKEFAGILGYLEPLALRHQAQLFDEQQNARRTARERVKAKASKNGLENK